MQGSSWQKFLDHLTRVCKCHSLMPAFASLHNNTERVTYCWNQPIVTEALKKWLQENFQPGRFGDGKCAKMATEFRRQGNIFFMKGQYEKALRAYNSGLLHVPVAHSYEGKSEDLALLFGNRSAVHFHMEVFTMCVDDIQVALDLGYPDDKRLKLYLRLAEAALKCGYKMKAKNAVDLALGFLQQSCERHRYASHAMQLEERIQMLANEDAHSLKCSKYLFQGGSNSLIPNASALIQMNYTASEGRFLTATEKLPMGSVIIKEVPYAAVLLPPWFDTHCQHCFDKIQNPVACYGCIVVMYCSEPCRKESWSQYHYFECGKLKLMEAIGVAHLALRVILVTKREVLVRYLSLQEELGSQVILETPYLNEYDSVYKLVTNDQQMLVEDCFQYAVTASLLVMVFEGFLANDFTVQGSCLAGLPRYEFGALFLRHIQQLVCNAHAITALKSNPVEGFDIVEQEQVRLATAIYPTTSLLNHACEPSIVNCFDKNLLIVKVVRDIHAGEQIYNCYGPHYAKMGYKDRHSSLKAQYFFDCKCIRCVAGAEEELQFDNYLCSKCAVAINPSSLICPLCCKPENIDQLKMKEKKGHDLFVSGLKLLQSSTSCQDLSHALVKFRKCYGMLKDIVVSTHKSIMEVQDVMAKCHAMLKDYETAIVFLQKCIAACELRFGVHSIEVTNELLKLCDIFMEFSVSRSFAASAHQQKYMNSFITLLDRAKSLVALNKGANCPDLLDLLDKETFVKQLHPPL